MFQGFFLFIYTLYPNDYVNRTTFYKNLNPNSLPKKALKYKKCEYISPGKYY
jgi:hypothetical protein